MLGVRVQPWALRYFALSVVSLLAALLLMALGLTYPALSLSAPTTLVAVHLITIGWLTLLMLGALHQFVPVITTRQLFSDRLPALILAFLVVGLCLMIVGFLALPLGPLESLSSLSSLTLPTGGGLVTTGIALSLVNLYVTLGRSRPLPLSARYVAVSLGFLTLTVLMGTSLALGLTGTLILPPSILASLLGFGLPIHLLSGIAGWFTLTAMGVSLKLLSMFTLAPEERGRVGEITFLTSAGGLSLAWLSGIVHVFEPAPFLAVLGDVGWAAAGIGIVLFLLDMSRMYRARRRRKLELNAYFATWSLSLLGVALAAYGVIRVLDLDYRAYPPLVFLALFGWLTGFGLSQLYKIVPFLTWIERYGRRMGRERIPLVQDLVNEKRATPYFVAYSVLAVLGAVSLAVHSVPLFRASLALMFVAVAFIASELLSSRRVEPAIDPVQPVGSHAAAEPLPRKATSKS